MSNDGSVESHEVETLRARIRQLEADGIERAARYERTVGDLRDLVALTQEHLQQATVKLHECAAWADGERQRQSAAVTVALRAQSHRSSTP